MKKNKIIMFTLYIMLSTIVSAQSSDVKIKLKSIRLDLTSLLFINDATGLMNIEILEISKNSYGIEPSISYVTAGSVGGSEHGSPFRDYNIMLYSLLKMGELTSFKVTLGYTHRTSIASYPNDYPDNQFKFGVSFYWDIIKYFGLCIRYSNAIKSSKYSGAGIGVGLSFNWSQ